MDLNDISLRLKDILSSKRFTAGLDNARSNWLNIPVENVIDKVVMYFSSLQNIQV